MPLKTVGLMVNRSKWEALQFAHEVIAWLTERDVGVLVDSGSAPLLGRDDIACDPEFLCDVEMLITLGGDGTILNASRYAAPHGIPILGVHMGRFGFIAETAPDHLFAHLDRLVDDDTNNLPIEERMMVRGEVVREGSVVFSAVGLNDIVVSKGARTRLLHFETTFSRATENPLLDNGVAYPADGVIISTPTGSTAYALSAGGPLIEPTVQALLVVPICPHTLAARPLIIHAAQTVTVTLGETDGGEVLFIADNEHTFALHSHDVIRVCRAEYSTRIVTLRSSSFYRKVRQRLLWGERVNG